MYIRKKIPIVSSHHCLIFVRKLGGSDEKANVEREIICVFSPTVSFEKFTSHTDWMISVDKGQFQL